MSDIELALADLGEIATCEIAKQGGDVAKNARIDLESKIGKSIITKNNSLNYKYKK